MKYIKDKDPSKVIVFPLVVVFFLVTVLWSGLRSSQYFMTNSDAIIATHQFSDGLSGNTVGLPALHTNIIMIPMLFVQGHLPYTYKSFVLLNTLLILITMTGWGLLLIRLFGKQFTLLIFLLLSSLLYISLAFNFSIGNSTFRNIGYPLSLWFVFSIYIILKAKILLKQKLEIAISSMLFSFLLAGDSFFVYSTIVPLLIVIFAYCLFKATLNKRIFYSLSLIFIVLIGASLIKLLLDTTGLIFFDETIVPKPYFVTWELLFPSIKVFIKQIIELQGGYIFGKAVALSSTGYLINIATLTIGLAGLIGILYKYGQRLFKNQELLNDKGFVLVVIAVAYFITASAYIFSGYVVHQLENGEIRDSLNSRYIASLSLITIIGVLWVIKSYFLKSRFLIAFCTILVVGILVSTPAVKSEFAVQQSTKPVPKIDDVKFIISTLKDNGVENIITDFWYGPPLRFWSNNKIGYAPQSACNRPLYFNSREDWYVPRSNNKSAIIINRGDEPFGYWNCDDSKLENIYGKPIKTYTIGGVRPGEIVKIWIYDYDVRSKIKPYENSKYINER